MVHTSSCKHDSSKSTSQNSKNNHKSVTCGLEYLVKLHNEKINTIKSNSKSKSSDNFKIIKIPNNPYLSSITSNVVYNLSKIKNFSVYFWKSTDDPSVNEFIQDSVNSGYIRSITDWSDYYKEQTFDGLSQYTSFLNVKSSTSESYEKSNIVCLLGDLQNGTSFGSCIPPLLIYQNPGLYDNKMVFYLSSTLTTDENITKGGAQYQTIIHEFGHGFGLAHPHDNGLNSTIMPGIGNIKCEENVCIGSSFNYPSIAGYINNSAYNTNMSYMYTQFFYPEILDEVSSITGYSQTLMPLDASALRWIYNLKSTGCEYIKKYGVKVINPPTGENKCQMIVGKNQEITFGDNCNDINFYFSNNTFRFNNIEPVKYQYNRITEKDYTFYPQDLCSTVAKLNFKNLLSSNIFIEKNALKTNLTLNCISNTVLNIYIIDSKNNYSISGCTYVDKKTGKKIVINNKSKAKINVFFNK